MPAPFPDKPFVGMPGSERSVEISHQEDRIVCYLARHTLWLVQAALLLITYLLVYISWWLWATPQGEDAPLYFRILVPASALIPCIMFIRNLLGPPRIEILLSNGDLLFFSRRTAQPAFTIPRQEVAGLDLTEQFYGSLGASFWRNLVVSVTTTQGKRMAICASPDEKLIHSFVAELASILKVPVKDLSP
jgi:hypothetical protein